MPTALSPCEVCPVAPVPPGLGSCYCRFSTKLIRFEYQPMRVSLFVEEFNLLTQFNLKIS